ISATRSPRCTVKSRWSRTTWSPNCLTTFSNTTIGDSPPVGVLGRVGVLGSVDKGLLQSPDEDRGRVAREQEDHPGEGDGLEVLEVAGAVLLRGGHHLHHRDREQERGVLEQGDRVVAERRDRVA